MEMSTNITQIRRLQDHLSSLGLLIGSISHGIKGLLTGLDGGMYLLDSGFNRHNQEQIKEGWEVVKMMVGRIRSMVLDLLYYAKERDLKWEKIDIPSFAADVASSVAPKIKEQHVEFVCEFDSGLGQFEVDASIVRSALTNILENALEACVQDTSKHAHRIVLAVHESPDHIVFSVSDDGIGMDKATKDKLFTDFFPSKLSKGTGLGLFVSNKIIRQHGGALEVHTTPGEGTRFTIKLPKLLPDSARTLLGEEDSRVECT
jgi:signal transduction histidine kinase